MSATRAEPAEGTEVAGLASVATISFLASRAVPSAGFFVALAGGAALARAAQRNGARRGYGASLAATLESIAIIGPIRLNVPLTQAITAPMLGRLHARGVRPLPQIAACALVRLLHNSLIAAFFIVVVAGVDAYTGTYDTIFGKLGLPEGTGAAVTGTVLAGLIWAAFASTVQVLLYRRALERWDDGTSPDDATPIEAAAAAEPPAASPRRFDPRACALAALAGFALLLSGTEPVVLAAVAGWLALATLAARGDRGAWPAGLVLAGALAFGALTFGLVGGQGIELALRRAARVALLVLVATWLRAAAGSEGIREVAHRVLDRLHRVPAVPEAARTLDGLGSDRRLVGAGRSLLGTLEAVEKRPLLVADAVLEWARRWAGHFEPDPPVAPLALRLRLRDGLLALAAASPALLLLV